MIQVNREKLIKALDRCAKVTSGNKGLVPVLTHAALDFDGGRLSYRATNLVTTIAGTVEAKGKGQFCVSPRDLISALAGLAGETVKLDAKDTSVKVEGSGKRSFKVKTLPYAEYPAAPVMDQDGPELNSSTILAAIRGVAFAAGGNESQENIRSVRLRANGTELESAATDGRRCAMFQTPTDVSGIDIHIPASVAHLLTECLSIEGSVKLLVSENSIGFSWGDQCIITQKPLGKLPAVENAFGAVFEGSAELDTETVAESVAALQCVDKERDILLTFSDSRLLIEAQGEGYARDELEVSCTQPCSIALSARYLNDALKVAGEKVTFRYGTGSETDPIMLECDGWKVMIMPILRETLKQRTGL